MIKLRQQMSEYLSELERFYFEEKERSMEYDRGEYSWAKGNLSWLRRFRDQFEATGLGQEKRQWLLSLEAIAHSIGDDDDHAPATSVRSKVLSWIKGELISLKEN